SCRVRADRRTDQAGTLERCLFTSEVISNMVTVFLPPKTTSRFASALISRPFCRPFFLMYSHTFLVTSVRGIGESPTILARSGDGCIGFMKPAWGLRVGLDSSSVFLSAMGVAVSFPSVREHKNRPGCGSV